MTLPSHRHNDTFDNNKRKWISFGKRFTALYFFENDKIPRVLAIRIYENSFANLAIFEAFPSHTNTITHKTMTNRNNGNLQKTLYRTAFL